MGRIRSILAATDFSQDSRYAAERAAILGSALAIPRGVLVHVLEQSWLDTLKQFVSSSAQVKLGIVDGVSRSLTELVEEIRQMSGFSFTPQILTGNTLDAIVEAAADFNLLVLGAHGRHPVRALALGTTSQRLLGKIRLPVLVVKSKPVRPYRRVLVAVDFSENSRKALEYGLIIAPQAKIILAHVFESLFEMKMVSVGVSTEIIEEYRTKARLGAEAQMTQFIHKAGMDPFRLVRVVEHGNAHAKLPEITQKLVPDLIVVGKHGKWRIEELLLGSVTLHVLAESFCDVLVVE